MKLRVAFVTSTQQGNPIRSECACYILGKKHQALFPVFAYVGKDFIGAETFIRQKC